ncbi:MAG: DUF2252 family protein [Marmoricola sp.]
MLDAAIADARKRTSKRAARKLTQVDDGRQGAFHRRNHPRWLPSPRRTQRAIGEFLDQYVRSASVDIRFLMREYVVA